jgi:serine/threonine protein kinase/regulator of sirC expression with transglutaminase-like and TPR domain
MRLTGPQIALMSRLLDEALPLNDAGRRRWLEALPAEYQDLFAPLRQALLPEFYRSPDAENLATFLESADEQAGRVEPTGLQPADRVGPYELIHLLGAGGMAEVWLAKRADGAFNREVALKLPSMTRVRRDLEQRFIRERDILASLEHPHIARLYDAGIDPQGLPYLSMEYVQGELLTHWCDAQRLDIRARLRLFLQVLDAVQYAHERQVIHRDLKPSNILVTKAGQTRLLDFGVATLLDDGEVAGSTPLTAIYGHVLTPIYASPEMIRGDPVTPRSDIYSLGVVLFELLTGDRPYRLNAGASRAILEQAIAAAEVRKPSTQIVQEAWGARSVTHEQLTRQLRGDVDRIVLKSLAKEPQSRYTSAAAMADDVQRYLEGKPIAARPPRLSYRLGKFLHRNRLVVSVGAGAAILVLAMLGYEIERRVDQAFDDAKSVLVTRPINEKSIAVLPFLDMSEKKDQGYFSDGLSEELITLLAQIQDLQVIARTSSFHFRNQDVSLREIAGTLGVAHVLEGSVRRAGNTVRVTAQLIRTDDGVHLWSQSYDRDVKDIFQVQDDIAAAVVSSLKIKLLAISSDPHRSDSPEAYNQFLLARQLGRRGNLEDIERAVATYRQAIALDPNYAAAYAGLSFSETAIANSTQDAARFALARDAAEKALELAPQFADAYRARAQLRLETLDFAGARADSETALTLAPGESAVQSLYGAQIAVFGKIPQAITAMKKAIDLDPLSGYAWANVGLFQTATHDYPAARQSIERALAISPTADSFHFALGQLDLLQGRLAEAQAEFQKQSADGNRRMGVAMVEHANGHDKQSEAALKELIAKNAGDMAYQVADVYAWRGEKDKAFEWLERAYQQRDSGQNGIAWDPLLSSLKGDSRFGTLLTKLQLSDGAGN